MEAKEAELTLEAVPANLDTVLDFVEAAVQAAGCPKKTVKQIALSLEELFINIASYAYGSETGTCTLRLRTEAHTDGTGSLYLWLQDRGMPYNPLDKADPDITLTAEERKIGGLGIYMVKQMMDEITYQYTEGENRLLIVKNWKL